MISASVGGLVDFSLADIFDRRWQRRVKLVLDEQERKNQLLLLQLDHAQHAGAMANVDNFDHHWTELGWLRNRVLTILYPWLPPGPMNSRSLAERMRQAYVSAIGDPDDQNYTAEMWRLIRHWQSREHEQQPRQF